MLKHRLMFGPVLIALLIGAVWLDVVLEETTGFAGVLILPILALAALGAVQEIAPIMRALQAQASRRLLSLCALLGLASCTLIPSSYSPQTSVAIVATAAGLAMFLSLLFYTRHKSTQGVVLATGVALICFVYLGLMTGFLFLIRRDFGAWELLATLLITKSYDIGAFFTGSAIGKHKLIPWLSPGKTWEGLFGGMVLSTLVAVGALLIGQEIVGVDASSRPLLGIELWQAALIGAGLGLVGQAGDLIASVFKRDAGVKDYSRLLPGFGGIMDVFDSPLLVAPVAFWVFLAVTGT
ncbi:MAG: phosphatidate cytidylyltransferase [Phycisphaerales bacterium JB050]